MPEVDSIDDIIASLRSTSTRFSDRVAALADRLQCAYAHNQEAIGNAQKMRATLLEVCDKIAKVRAKFEKDANPNVRATLCDVAVTISQALAAPSRNCDVLTPEEQVSHFANFCKGYRKAHCGDCRRCKFYCPTSVGFLCFARWSQDTYSKPKEGIKSAEEQDSSKMLAIDAGKPEEVKQ